jgi:uncharacterized protein (DUF305 family)/NAD-dependent dihydropyrimidine dehydrogenase PreA subunit
LGWFGKNTNLVNPRLGSFFFIGSLLVDLELSSDDPFQADRCGSCTRCLDACPTSAFAAPRVLDATRCISYLTIELKGDIPEHLHEPMGTNLYGCDICQDVCPYNVKFARELREPAFVPRTALQNRSARELAQDFVNMDDEGFRSAFRNSPLKRAKRRGLARNAAVVLKNIGALGVAVIASATSVSAQVAPTSQQAGVVRAGYSAADVRFMQGMIEHHAQALAMTALLRSRTARPDMHLLAERIDVSQKDEIGLMSRWLERRREHVPDYSATVAGGPDTRHSMSMPGMDTPGGASSMLMPGMLTPAQLAALAATSGPEFDRLFLEDMIRHHEGALVMVHDLFATNGAAQEPEIFQYASDIDADQRAEIMRMRALLAASPGGRP